MGVDSWDIEREDCLRCKDVGIREVMVLDECFLCLLKLLGWLYDLEREEGCWRVGVNVFDEK